MNTADETVIEVHALTKRFGTFSAVDAIDFQVRSGEVFGFLGPNGAGKTTTINMLTGLARPTSGVVRVAGQDVASHPKRAQHLMGIVPDESNLYPELTGRDNLHFCAALYGMRRAARQVRAAELLDTFGLAEVADRKFATYSRGTKRKLTIAAGLVHRPPLLFLDEPTTGIDVASARHIRGLLADLKASGITIFLTTHYIEEAERLCDRVAFLVGGRLVRVDTLANLLRAAPGTHQLRLSLLQGLGTALAGLQATFPHARFEQLGDRTLAVHAAESFPLAPLLRFLQDRGVDVVEARVARPSLEDVFVQLTGKDLAALDAPPGREAGGAR